MNQEEKGEVEARLIPLVDWPKYHAWPPVGGLRHIAFWAPPGSERVFVRCGRRILVNEQEFLRFVATNPKIKPVKATSA